MLDVRDEFRPSKHGINEMPRSALPDLANELLVAPRLGFLGRIVRPKFDTHYNCKFTCIE